MAIISPFRPMVFEEPEQESAEMRCLREMANGADVRFLLGDIFMRVAASAPLQSQHPFTELLERLLGDQKDRIQCGSALKVLMGNLDLLRSHDLMRQQRRNLREMLKETDHGRDMMERNRKTNPAIPDTRATGL